MATINIYPQSNIGTTTRDGYVQHNITSGTFPALRNAVTGTTSNVSASFFGSGIAINTVTTNMYSIRAFISFDLSAIPPGSIITSATLTTTKQASWNLGGTSYLPNIVLTQGTTATTNNLLLNDYNIVNFGAEIATRVPLVVAQIPYVFTLNATGLASLAPLGIVNFGMVSSNEYDNVAFPTDVNTKVEFYGVEDVTLTNRPTLAITYTPPMAPTVTTGATSYILDTTAKIAGTINPNGSSTTYVINYGTTIALGTTTAPIALGSGNSIINILTNLIGLSPNTTYFYRIQATSIGGITNGTTLSFATYNTQPPITATITVDNTTTIINGVVKYTVTTTGGYPTKDYLWLDGGTGIDNRKTYTTLGIQALNSVTVSDTVSTATAIAPIVTVLNPIKIPMYEITSKQDFDKMRVYNYNY
jgi:hypothetical protein